MAFLTSEGVQSLSSAVRIVSSVWALKHNDWEISEDESCSDHNIIKFKIGNGTNHENQHNYNGIRYITNEKAYSRFDKKLKELIAMKFRMNNSE